VASEDTRYRRTIATGWRCRVKSGVRGVLRPIVKSVPLLVAPTDTDPSPFFEKLIAPRLIVPPAVVGPTPPVVKVHACRYRAQSEQVAKSIHIVKATLLIQNAGTPRPQSCRFRRYPRQSDARLKLLWSPL